MARRNKPNSKIECLDMEEDIEEIGFTTGDINIGNALRTFNFAPEPAASSAPLAKAFEFNKPKPAADTLADNRKIKTELNMAAPSIEDEAYTIGRYYKLRYTTAKMLNEIKASHHDVNVYMNTIVDEAIRHYYSFCFKKARE